MNQIEALLNEVLASGKMPTVTEVASVVDRGTSVADKHSARTKLYRTAKQIVNALDAGLADQAQRLASDVGNDLAQFTADGGTTSTPREIADQIAAGRDQHATRGEKPDIAPLRELFVMSTRNGLAASELDKIRTRPGASADEVQRWRADVLNAGRKIRAAYAGGNQGLARRMAAEAAVAHSGLLAPAERVDPAADIDDDDPRALANLVANHNRQQ